MTRTRTMTMAMISRMWMKPPMVYEDTRPSNQRMSRTTAMVHNMAVLLPDVDGQAAQLLRRRQVADLEQVAHALHSVHGARELLGAGALVGRVHAAGERHHAFVGGHVDVAGLHVRVLHELGLHRRGDLGVVDLHLRRL